MEWITINQESIHVCNYELMREDCADIIFAVVYIK